MQENRLKLPNLSRPLFSAQVSDVEEYRRWEQTRKRAYRAQLDRQVLQHRRGRELSLQQKTRERANVSAMVSQQQSKLVNSKYMKIKTEQKYMQDNFRLMKQPKKAPRRQQFALQKEHPFIKMIEEEEVRRKETKNSFIFQNQLNDLQTEMKRSMKKKTRQIQKLESKKYVDHVEEEFRKHEQKRMEFQRKYLKVQEGQNKRDYLDSVKGGIQRKNSRKHNADGRKSRGQWTLEERKKEICSIEKQIRNVELPITHKYHLEPHFSLRKQYDMTIGCIPSSQHIVTQRSVREIAGGYRGKVVTERAESSLEVSQNLIKYRGNLINPESGRRQFKHYDIINNSQKIIVK